VVRDGQDVLDAMLGAGARHVVRTGPPLGPEPAAVLAAVESGAASADAIAAALDLPAGRASAALARLELLGYLAPTAVGTFTRTLLVPPSQGGRSVGPGSPVPSSTLQ
jgi:predicted Rossmann fold nucleotide-binding protein DprA/Smf involved in DNA uptake